MVPRCSQYVSYNKYNQICYTLNWLFNTTKGQTPSFEILRNLYRTEPSWFEICSEFHANSQDDKLHISIKVEKLKCTLHLYGNEYLKYNKLHVKSTDMSVGMNTLAQATFLNITYPASVTIANRFDTFAHSDALIEIDDAGLRMRY